MSTAERILAPITMGARDIRGLTPQMSADTFSEQVAQAVADQDEIERGKQERKRPFLPHAALALGGGAALGGMLGAVKGSLITHDLWNPKLMMGAAAVGGAGSLAIALLRRAAAKKLTTKAKEQLEGMPAAVRYVASHPGTQEKARDWEAARWAPFVGAEVGALAGGLGGLAYAASTAKPEEGISAVPGVIGAGALGLAGLGLGYLYRKHKQNQFLEHVENELSMSQSPKAQEATLQAEVEREPMLKAAEDTPVELDEEGRPKKRWYERIPASAGLYSGIAGLGGAALLSQALSGSDMERVSRFREVMSRIANNPNPATDVGDYIYAGHDMAKARPFYLDMTDVMRIGRAFYPANDPRSWKPTSGAHYTAFQKSPFSAYTQLLREMGDYDEGRGEQDKTFLKRVGEGGNPAHLSANGEQLVGVSDAAKQQLSDKLRAYLAGWDVKNVANSFTANREQLLQAAAEYAAPHRTAGTSPTTTGFYEYVASRHPKLLPAKRLFDATMAAGLPEKAKRYADATHLADQVRPWLLRAAGLAAIGGAAGLGYWLYKRNKEKNETEEQSSANETVPPVDTPSAETPVQEQLEKAAMALVKEALVTGSHWPTVSTNAPLLNGNGGAPERYVSGKHGARRIYNYGLGAIESWKSSAKPQLEKHVKTEKVAEDDPNAHGEELDDVALGMARVLEEQYGSAAKTEPPPSTESTNQSSPTESAGSDAPPSTKVAEDRASLPYRKRVEVYAMKDGKVYGGVYKDGGFGVFGGGIEEDDLPTAAAREFLEETGLVANNVRLVPVEPVKIDWNPPYKSEKQAERAKQFRGAQTFFVVADLDDSKPVEKAPGDDGKSPLRWPRLYDVAEAIDLCEKASPTEEGVKRINAARVEVLGKLRQQKVADAAQFLPRKEVLVFTPSGKLAIRRRADRRFELPSDIEGKPVPYEQPVHLLPEGGVPEKGVHGYQIALHSAEADLPEGFEEVDPQDALKDLYAALGKPENRPYQSLDRARARALLRLVKKRTLAPAVV